MSQAISQHLNKVIEERAREMALELSPGKSEAKRLAAAGIGILDAPNIGQEGTQWRRLTANPGRELIPLEQERMIEIAYWLWKTNPLAGWLIDVTTAFIVNEGIPYEANNEDTKAVLDGFWDDPVNRLSLNFPKFIDALHIFGELCLPCFTAQQTGRIRLGYTDPAQIKEVITDPENVMVAIGVLTKSWAGEVGGYSVDAPARAYRTILPEGAETVLSPVALQIREQLGDGECFFWSINNVPNSPRGCSDLLPVADWCDAYEQFLFDYADKWPQLNMFVWDLLVEGGDDDVIGKWVKAFTKKSGSVFGHNEKVTLEEKTPDLKSVDAAEGARIFRNHILGRFGFPEHWFGGGGDVNRATAAEMDAPALKMLGRKKLTVKYIVEDMLGYQVRQARMARYLRVSDDEAKFTTTVPQMETKDVSKLASAAEAIARALAMAELNGYIDKDHAQKIFASITAFTGVEIDLEEVRRSVEQEKETEGYQDYKKRDAA